MGREKPKSRFKVEELSFGLILNNLLQNMREMNYYQDITFGSSGANGMQKKPIFAKYRQFSAYFLDTAMNSKNYVSPWKIVL